MPNRLAETNSPYLLQHAANPVDWHPWGPEALAAARAQDKPIFLSIGYSACHWCHVMAHESFEDPGIARLLNRDFISIKVDREEHPELDQVYMEAVQAMTGHGGWPLSAFLTPELEPFFGGTYWPPSPRGGMPGFDQVLAAVADAWKHRRGEALQQAKRLAQWLRDSTAWGAAPGAADGLGHGLIEAACSLLGQVVDPVYGGFGSAPKFPQPMALQLLLRRWHRTGDGHLLKMAATALDKMAAGGLYDHLGGGFHRYSTDARWLVPHFEKMLYDNALLAACYLEAWQATGEPQYAQVVRETLDYVLRDMTHPAGGFYTSEDADSEGREGLFYLWTLEEVRGILGPEATESFAYVYDVTEAGNFDGRNILNRAKTPPECAEILGRDPVEMAAELVAGRRKLFEARSRRARPGRDDKVLAGWNGLMIDALARAGAVLGEPRYADAAARAADFLLSPEGLRGGNGGLLHAWRRGRGDVDAFLEDYAALAGALVTLYESRFEERWIDAAIRLADEILARFADPERGGFYTVAADHGPLLVQKKDVLDASVPSGGGLATAALLRLGKLCARDDYLSAAEAALRAAAGLMERSPLAVGQMLLALDAYLGPTPELVVLGGGDRAATAEVLAGLHRPYLPNKVVAFRDGADGDSPRSVALAPIFRDKEPLGPGPTLFLCEDSTCRAPVSGKEAVLDALGSLRGRA